jgi:hypothetical protein
MSAVFGLYCDVGDVLAPSAVSPTVLDDEASEKLAALNKLSLASSLCESSTEDLHALLDPHERRIRAAWLGARRKARQLRGLTTTNRPPSIRALGRSPGDQFELEPEPPSPVMEEKPRSVPTLGLRQLLKGRSPSESDPLSYWSPDGVEDPAILRLELARGDAPMRQSRSADAVVGVWAKRLPEEVLKPQQTTCAWSMLVCCSASTDGERGG